MISNSAIRAVVSSEKDTVASGASKNGGLRGKLNKVVLAYSGGLDTSVIVPWLRYTVVCVLFLKCLPWQFHNKYLFLLEKYLSSLYIFNCSSHWIQVPSVILVGNFFFE